MRIQSIEIINISKDNMDLQWICHLSNELEIKLISIRIDKNNITTLEIWTKLSNALPNSKSDYVKGINKLLWATEIGGCYMLLWIVSLGVWV